VHCLAAVARLSPASSIGAQMLRIHRSHTSDRRVSKKALREAAIASLVRSGARYASHVYDPLFLQGTKTFAFEIFEQLGGVPGAIVVPAGNGTLLLGAETTRPRLSPKTRAIKTMRTSRRSR